MPDGTDPRPQKIQDSQEELLAAAIAAHLLDVDTLETGINAKLKSTTEAKYFNIDFKNYLDARKKTLVTQSSKSFIFGATSTVSLINVERKNAGLSRLVIGKDIPYSMIDKEMLDYLKVYKGMIEQGYTKIGGKKIYWLKDADARTRKAFYEALEKGVAEGKGVPELTRELKPLFSELKTNARLTAHHELSYVNDHAGDIRRQAHGIEWDQWYTVGDDRVRPLHQLYDGQYFKVGEGPWPSDFVQCRCVRLPIVEKV